MTVGLFYRLGVSLIGDLDRQQRRRQALAARVERQRARDAAAERCHLSQSAFSVSIQKLESASARSWSNAIRAPCAAIRFYLVCRRDHALAGRRRIALADLAGCDLIHLARSTSVRQQVELLIRGIAVNDTGLEVEHLATVAGLIEHGPGVSLVPKLTLFQFRQLKLVAIALQTSTIVRPIYIVRQKERSLSAAAAAMFDLILDSFQRLP